MADQEDWDLYAIVKSCTSAANRSDLGASEINFESSPFDCLASLTFDGEEEGDSSFCFPNLAQQRNNTSLGELQDSYKPFLPNYSVISSGHDHQGGGGGGDDSNNYDIPSSSISDNFGVIFSGQNQQQLAQQQQRQNHHPPPPPPPQPLTDVVISQPQPQLHVQQQQNQRRQLHQQAGISTTNSLFPLRTTQSQATRSRKKKSNQKRLILHVAADNLSNDVWAWRKYGQKPIKGSPYPRNYYRCSSSKGCAARKQVERSNTDPDMFVVSYTGDHTHPRPTHRNSLAGSTRSKVQQPIQKPENKEVSEPPANSADKAASCSSPLSATSLSPRTPLSAPIDHATGDDQDIIKTENMEDDDDEDDCDNDNEEYDDDLLIPNMALHEDLIKGFQELVSASEGGAGAGAGAGVGGGGGGGGGGGLSNSGNCPAFGDNFSSSSVVGASVTTAAGASAGGG